MTSICQYDRDSDATKVRRAALAWAFAVTIGLSLWVMPAALRAQAVDPQRDRAADLITALETGLVTLQAGDTASYQRLTGLLSQSREIIHSLVGDSDPDLRMLSDRWDVACEQLVSVAQQWPDAASQDGQVLLRNHPVAVLQHEAEVLLRELQNVPAGALSSADIHSHFTNRVSVFSERLVALEGGPQAGGARDAIDALKLFLANQGAGTTADDPFRKYMPGNRPVLRAGAGLAETAQWFAGMKALTSTALAEDSKLLAQDIASGRRGRDAAMIFKRSVVDLWVPDITSDISAALAAIDTRVASAVAFADTVLTVDVSNREAVWRIAGPDHYKTHMDLLQDGVAGLALALTADRALAREHGPDRERQRERLVEAKRSFALLRRALEKSRPR